MIAVININHPRSRPPLPCQAPDTLCSSQLAPCSKVTTLLIFILSY